MAMTLHIDCLRELTGAPACRAFGHALSASHGMVVAAPLSVVDGKLTDMIDGCPIPWSEACALIETTPSVSVNPADPGFSARVHQLAALAGEGWRFSALPELRALVFGHDTGLRVALAMDLSFSKEAAHA